ncbi:MAG: adenylosuccinate synthase [Thermoanaerobaculia bacterium]|nr:adenylosuccinate synthase [Thermoanaerobaculia bacterium]
MSNVVVIGMQWGDEGKGKVVDILSPGFDAVVRFQGGHNAGHTVKFGDERFALHLVPSGILRPESRCVLGNGMVVHPGAFLEEIDMLAGLGVDTDGRLFVSNRASLLLDVHIALDKSREAALGDFKIGTTSRGIGPAYEAKVARDGLRLYDLMSDDFEARIEEAIRRRSRELGDAEVTASLVAEGIAAARAWRPRMAEYVRDTTAMLNEWIEGGRRLLFEGAQGTLLDVDHGTYPFVTSSNTVAGYFAPGTGVSPRAAGRIVGVLKAYTTRVGEGPFPTELHDDTGERIRDRGNEFGTTTGRPRRCGWLDLVAARYARRVSGVDSIALTKLDVLDSLAEIPVCTGYRIGGETVATVPADTSDLARVEPVYETLPGWQTSTVGTVDYEELPSAARGYVDFIEASVGARVDLISTGARREETVLRDAELFAAPAPVS